MMVKMKTGTSFRRTVAYVLGATKEQVPHVLAYRDIDLDMCDVLKINRGKLSRKHIHYIARYVGNSFDLQASCRLSLTKPVRHYMMTFPPSDAPLLKDDCHLWNIVKDYIDAIGISNTQCLVVRHCNTENPHVHIVFNPVDNNLNVISESKQFSMNQRLCKKLTMKYGLHFSNPRKYNARLLRSMSGVDLKKVGIRKMIEEVLEHSDTPKEFQENLLLRRIRLIFHHTAERVIKGVSFQYLGDGGKKLLEYKGSSLSRSLSYKALNKYFILKVKMKSKIDVQPIQKKKMRR